MCKNTRLLDNTQMDDMTVCATSICKHIVQQDTSLYSVGSDITVHTASIGE